MFKTLTAVAATLLFAGSVSADLVNPDIPSWRGDAGTGFAQWDSFTDATGGANAPDQGFGFNVFNFAPTGGIITGSGNLYSPSGGLNIHVYQAGPPIFGLNEAVMNISFAGTPIDTDNVQAFVGAQGSGSYVDSVAEFRGSSGEGMFATQTWSFTFDLSAFSGGAEQLSFFFDSPAAHTSIDAMSIDYNTIPAPGALMALGLLGVARRRRG